MLINLIPQAIRLRKILARQIKDGTPIMGFKSPFGHGGVGAGGTDVLAEKRDYAWQRRVYGQICFASALGATSTWGQITVPVPGVAEDNKYGYPAYLVPGSRIRKRSGGGSTPAPTAGTTGTEFDDDPSNPNSPSYDEDLLEPEFDPNTGRQLVDQDGNPKYKSSRTTYKYKDPRQLQEASKATKSSGKNRPPGTYDENDAEGVYDRDDVYAPASHVVSISTSANATGMREEGTVTVKSYNGLHVGGPSLYGGMGMSWGYMDFSGKVVRSCGFGGYCNGGSVTLDSDGGYTVTVSGFKPIGILQGQHESPTIADGGVVTVEDELGGKYVGNNILSRAGAQDALGRSGTKPSGDLVSTVPRNFGTVINKADKEGGKGEAYRYHVRFGTIIEELNSVLGKQGKSKIVIEDSHIDGERVNSVALSAYPIKCLYGDMSPLNGPASPAFESTTVEWASPGQGIRNVAFSGEYLCKVGAENTRLQTFDNNGIGKGLNVISFINGLIQLANDCCGNAFGACQAGFSAERDDPNIYIYDPSFSPGGAGGGGGGFPRTATITYKTSGEMDAAFVAELGKKAGPGGATVDAVMGGASAGPVGGAGDAIAAVASNPIDENCAALQANLLTAGANGMIFFPADLSVTTDGSCTSFNPYAFFGSGHVPTGQMTPPSGKSVGFICTGVDQSVSGGDWTTTISGTAVIR